MKNIVRYLHTVTATIVFLIGSATLSYGANTSGALSKSISEQLDVLQLGSSSPEPETMLLLGIGLLLMATVARKGKSRS